jgi:hypothetical protein
MAAGGNVVSVFLIFFAVLILVILGGIRHSRKTPAELADLASDLGIRLTRDWTFSKRGGAGSTIRCTPGYTALYRGLPVFVAHVRDREGRIIGTAFVLPLTRSLPFPLFCTCHVDSFGPSMTGDTYRDIYLNRVDTGIAGLKCWSTEEGRSRVLPEGGDVLISLKRLASLSGTAGTRDLSGLPRGGFMVNDREIILLVSSSAMLSREWVEEAYRFCQILSAYGSGGPGVSMAAQKRGWKVWMVVLFALLAGFIIGAMITGQIKPAKPSLSWCWKFNG